MASFDEYHVSLAVRDAISKIVKAEIDSQRPRYRYAEVKSIDAANYTCTVTYVGDTSEVTVRMGALQPSVVGQKVRIEGMKDDRYITDVYGPAFIRGRTGDVDFTAGSTLPTGALWCDGSSLLRADWPGLFTEIGTTYGSADGTHFNLPNFNDKFPRGNTRGTGGGADTHQHAVTGLTVNAHTHSIAATTHTHTLDDNGAAQVTIAAVGTWAVATRRISTGSYNYNLGVNVAGGGNTNAAAVGAGLIGKTAGISTDNGGTSGNASANGISGSVDSGSNIPAYTGVAYYIWT